MLVLYFKKMSAEKKSGKRILALEYPPSNRNAIIVRSGFECRFHRVQRAGQIRDS